MQNLTKMSILWLQAWLIGGETKENPECLFVKIYILLTLIAFENILIYSWEILITQSEAVWYSKRKNEPE